MTKVDAARALDEALDDVDWREFPGGTMRDMFHAPSGRLSRVRIPAASGASGAPRVVLVPGVAGSKEDFVLLFPLLAAAGFRVESFDLAGHWESEDAGPEHLDPPRERYDNQLFLDDLVAILEDDPVPAHVLGYSFAGIVAQQALVERPGLFRSLTLMSAPPTAGQVFRTVKRIGPLSDMAPQRAAGLILWGLRYNLNRMPEHRIAFVRERMLRTRRESVNDIVALMMSAPDLADQVAAAPIPKLVAVGERDMWPLDQHAEYAERIGARLAVYPTGHNPCEKTPHQLTGDLVDLFRSAEHRE